MKKSPLFFANPLCPKAVKVAARQPQCPQRRRQRGATAIEYGVIVALIAAALFFVFGAGDAGGGSLADMISSLLDDVKTTLGITGSAGD
ncbi:Flp family type IVb pilin [Halomonas sp. DP8Y7-3]|uniref:Flp family type IVb pilin n=1 Tax=Halomonas TaxID=2745 RepID=UPI001A8C5ED5|nr:Flp family type IVb pilin [Halomonas sp. DP8Y7-3]MBN8411990.1 Flp family type IVb pilin [Halomonas litopenaei]MBY5930030.1 Flp family type IVb pilin [Halomonas sp. DP8Y7-3]